MQLLTYNYSAVPAMKRSPLRSSTRMRTSRPLKTRSPLKSSRKLKRKIKTPEAKAKERLWELCKLLTRTRYGNICYTCGEPGLSGVNWHTGHFIASSVGGAYLRYDLRNLRPQCQKCNVFHHGNAAIYYRNMVEREGQAYVDELFADRNRIVKADLKFYLELIERYTQLANELK